MVLVAVPSVEVPSVVVPLIAVMWYHPSSRGTPDGEVVNGDTAGCGISWVTKDKGTSSMKERWSWGTVWLWSWPWWSLSSQAFHQET